MSKRVTITLPEEWFEKLEKIASEFDVKPAWLAAYATKHFLEKSHVNGLPPLETKR